MHNMRKIYSINDYTINNRDKTNAYISGFDFNEYVPGHIYHIGDRIVRIHRNSLVILECVKLDSSNVFNENEWKVITFNNDLNTWMKLPESNRTLLHDLGQLKAYTDVSGRFLYDIIDEMLFGTGGIEFLSGSTFYIDRTVSNLSVPITIKYREGSKQINSIKFVYDGNVVGESYLPSDSISFNINYEGANDKSKIYYEVIYDGDSVSTVGTAMNLLETFPTYVGVIKDLNNPTVGLEKRVIAPNSEINILKDNNEYGYCGVLVFNSEWRQLSSCMLEEYTNITESIFSKHVMINGFEYKMIYTHPNMLKNIKLKFTFSDKDV